MLKVSKAVLWLPLAFPLYLIRFSIGGLPTNVLEVLVILVFFVYLFESFFRYFHNQKDSLKRFCFPSPHLPYIAWGFLGLAILLSVVIVPRTTFLIDGKTLVESQRIALGILKGWIIIPLIFFFLLKQTLKNYRDLLSLLYSYIFSALPLALWGFYQFITKNFITLDARVSGPFINANYLALYLEPAVITLLILITFHLIGFRKLKIFSLQLILAIFYVFILITTHSYASLLAVIVSFILCLCLIYKYALRFKRFEFQAFLKKFLKFFLIGFVGVALMAIFFFIRTEKWQKFFDFANRGSSAVRVEVYKISLELIKQNPLLGLGLGQFETKYNLKAAEILGHAPYEWVMIHPHSTFLAMWLNLGALGFILFLYLLFYCFKVFFQSLSFNDRNYKLIGLAMLMVIVLHGIVDTHFFKNDLAMIFWLSIACILFPQKAKIEAQVVSGLKLGRTIGFPTINLKVLSKTLEWEKLPYGIYASKVYVNKKWYKGAMHYGSRPAIADQNISFEIHLLHFEGDLLHQKVQVQIYDFIRGVMDFSSLDELKEQMAQDVQVVEKSLL